MADPFDMTQGEQNQIEALVDKYSVLGIVAALGRISSDKAEHVAHTWQDHGLAALWRKRARVFDKMLNNRNTNRLLRG